MATKLECFNGALQKIGQRRIASLTVNESNRKDLDTIWGADGKAPRYVLEKAWWKFALRTVKLEYDTALEPEFGYQHAFQIPSDYIRTYSLCEDEYFNSPLLQYHIEGDYFFAEHTELYLRYVSSGADYGLNLSGWPETFQELVEFHLARRLAPHIESNVKIRDLEDEFKNLLNEAKNYDCLEEPQTFPAPRGWATARRASHRQEQKRFGR